MTGDVRPHEERPDPDVLLAKLKREEKSSHGRFRIYLGMAPGVGKTYAMLNEGRRRQQRGTDVVVGYVETYGRPLTVQALEGLEVIPRRRVTYRGVTLEEMDTAAIISRNPQVALVDELAHTNAPWSKHEKRWEDVEEILDHGITVISTVNVQHLESLNDLVENITGVQVRETVPDHVLDDADEVELVDMSPEALQSRMRHGNIYPPAQAQAALQRFFTIENLAALRRIALMRTEQEAEQQVEQYMRELHEEHLQTSERFLVVITPQPLTKVLLRRGWRVASALHADLLAAYIDTGARLNDQEQHDLDSNLRLAEDLGAQVERLAGTDVVSPLLAFLRAEHITQVIVSNDGGNGLRRLIVGSLADRLLRLLPDIDIHVIGDRRESSS